MVTYPSLDFNHVYITLAKTLKINGERYGVDAIDISQSFVSHIFEREKLEQVKDIILITELEKFVLYSRNEEKQHLL